MPAASIIQQAGHTKPSSDALRLFCSLIKTPMRAVSGDGNIDYFNRYLQRLWLLCHADVRYCIALSTNYTQALYSENSYLITFSYRKKRENKYLFCCISLEHWKLGAHRDIHPNTAQSGKHWDAWPRLGAGLEDVQEEPSAYKVRFLSVFYLLLLSATELAQLWFIIIEGEMTALAGVFDST